MTPIRWNAKGHWRGGITSSAALRLGALFFFVGWAKRSVPSINADEDKCHVARCLEFPSLGAHGKTADKALKEIRAVVAASIVWMQEEKEPVPEP